MFIQSRLTFAVMVVGTIAVSTVEAQVSGGRPGNSNSSQQMAEIQRLLSEGDGALKRAVDQAATARGDFQRAETEHRNCVRETSLAREAAEEAAKKSPESIAARRRVEELKSQWDERKARTVDALTKSDADYQKLTRSLSGLLDQRKSANTNEPDSRRVLASQIAHIEGQLRNDEAAKLAQDQDAVALKQRLKDAEDAFRALMRKNNDEVEKDERLLSAKTKCRRINDELRATKQKLAQADANVSRIQANMKSLVAQRSTLERQPQPKSGGILVGPRYTSSGNMIGSSSCGRCGRSVSIDAARCHNCGAVFQGTKER